MSTYFPIKFSLFYDNLCRTITVDPFTAELFKIYETVKAEGCSQVS